MLVSGIPFKSAVSIQPRTLGLLKLNLGDGEGQGGRPGMLQSMELQRVGHD